MRLRHDSGALAATTTTDGAGFYAFTISPGPYFLEFVRPAALVFTTRDVGSNDNVDSDVNPTSGTTVVFTLGAGGPDLFWDAGLEPALLGDLVWLDANGNGLQDSGEPGVSGIPVHLLSEAGLTLLSTVTDATGRYGFAGVASGNYRIELAREPGSIFTLQHQGSDPKRDSDADPSTGRTALFAYTAGTALRSIDAGLTAVAIFVDGFEWGDLASWSTAVP